MEIKCRPSHRGHSEFPPKQAICLSLKPRDLVHTKCSPCWARAAWVKSIWHRTTKLDRKVALKILPADIASNRDRMQRFVREAKAAAIVKARELDPLSSVIARDVALVYYFKRDYVRAMVLLRQAKELGPSLSTTFEIGVYIQNRLIDEALEGSQPS